MIRWLLRRAAYGALVIWGIVTLLFLIFNLLGDPTEMLKDQRSDLATTDAIRKAYHLDQPVWKQYLYYLNDLSPIGFLNEEDPELEHKSYIPLFSTGGGSFLSLKTPWMRRSFQTNRKVGEMIWEALPGTLILAFAAIFIACLLGIPLGTWAALRRDRPADRIIVFVTLLGISAPSFFMAVVIIRIFAVALGDVTHLNITGYMFQERIFGEGYFIEWKNLFLPALALGIRPLSIITQLTRSSMMEVMSSDYIRTARAKGLNERKVVMRHALQNALNPVITSISGWFASLLAGAFFIETIFDWQGIGKLTIDALGANDYPVILGTALFIGFVFVLINILVDLAYSWIDPRVQVAG